MSRENVEIVKAAFEAWNGGDRESVLGFAHPEVVVDATRRVFNPTTYVGREGLRRMLAETDDTWEEFRAAPLEFIDAGDRVVVIGRVIGTGKGSGVEVEQPFAAILAVRDGHIIRWELGYANRSEALEAVGLRE